MIRENGMVVMTEEEYVEMLKVNKETVKEDGRDYKKEYKELLNFLPKIVVRENQTTDVRLSRNDFVKLHNYGVEQMDMVSENYTTENNLVYDNNVTVHWMGYYCDCLDGAQPANYIFPAIKDLDDEMGREEF